MMSHVLGKDKNEILESLTKTAQVGSSVHEQQKAAITVRCTEDIEKAFVNLGEQLKINSESSDSVARKIYWLNVILALATVVGAVSTVVIAIKT
jgi:hypothetical protein